MGRTRLGVDSLGDDEDVEHERGDSNPVRNAPGAQRRDHTHHRHTDEESERPRCFGQPDDSTALFVLHVIGDPCAEPEIEALLRQREYCDADSEHQKVRGERSDDATECSADETEQHRGAMREAINESSGHR
jgi:hypothetical protein